MANTNYVKFLRGTQAAYDRLSQLNQLDENTLYFITNEGGFGSLYMGDRVISGGDTIISSAYLTDLKDVVIENAGTNSFLVKDGDKWVNKSLDEVVELIQNELDIDPTITQNITNLQSSITEINGTIEALDTAVKAKIDATVVESALAEKADSADVEAIEEALESKADKAIIEAELELKANATELEAKADVSYVNEELNKKASIADVEADLELKADTSYVNEELNKKANIADVEADLAKKADITYVDSGLELKANVVDVYTKNDVYTKSEVNSAIAGANHLKRTVVDKVEDIDYSAEGADQYIYMVPTGLQSDDDKYDEYMVIDGSLEKVGSWEVNLDPYATTEYVNQELSKKVTAVEGYGLISAEESEKLKKLTIEGDQLVVSGTVNASNVRELYNNVVTIVTGTGSAIYDGSQKELLGIEKGAEVNIIDAVSNEFTIGENRTLNVKTIDASKITNLNNHADFITISNRVEAVATEASEARAAIVVSIEEIQTQIDTKFEAIDAKFEDIDSEFVTVKANVATNTAGLVTVNGRIDGLKSEFDDYVELNNAAVAELKDILTWKSIESVIN